MAKSVVFAILGVLAAAAAAALEADSELPEVLVISATPVPGMSIDIDKVPGAVQSLSIADLAQDGAPSLLKGLSSRLSSININDTLADSFQPDILYRGFEASPVLGTPQGLAVYQNGVRINEAFGDTVNWDLFPDIAIDRLDIVSANPLFGLNALGGALSMTLKNAFSAPGGDAEFSGGSFQDRQASAEYGANNGTFGIYGALRLMNQNGWRLFSHDAVRNYFVDLSLRTGAFSADLAYTRADNRLFGPGVAPVQSLAISPEEVFTGPQSNLNQLDFVNGSSTLSLGNAVALEGVLYLRNFRQSVTNGDASNYVPCTFAADRLCQADGVTPLTNLGGGGIPDLTHGGSGILGQNDFERIRSSGWGGSLQFTDSRPLGALGNFFAAGITIDTAASNFYSGTQLGIIDPALIVEPSRYFVDTPEGGAFASTPVNLNANSKYYGAYFTDTLDLTAALSLTASARYNIAKLDLTDQLGTALSGNNRFSHLNPAVGATYKASRTITLYAGYSTNNRAPTPSEIECSNPLLPCRLPSSVASDPPNLRQVVAHTAEVGARGRLIDGKASRLSWNLDVFRTDLRDDIYGIATSLSAGFFQNIGSTRRQGFEAGLNWQSSRWSGFANYSYVDATFRSPLLVSSPSNPLQDANGDIQVEPGDRLPLIPLSRVKLGADINIRPQLSVGASLLLATASYYRGDEANLNPQLPGYHVISLRSTLTATPHLSLFANVQNLFDERYSTVGLFGDPTGVNAPGVPAAAVSNSRGVDNRFQSPAQPRSYFAGIRFTF